MLRLNAMKENIIPNKFLLYYDSKQNFAGPFWGKGYDYQNVLLSLLSRIYMIGVIYGMRWKSHSNSK